MASTGRYPLQGLPRLPPPQQSQSVYSSTPTPPGASSGSSRGHSDHASVASSQPSYPLQTLPRQNVPPQQNADRKEAAPVHRPEQAGNVSRVPSSKHYPLQRSPSQQSANVTRKLSRSNLLQASRQSDAAPNPSGMTVNTGKSGTKSPGFYPLQSPPLSPNLPQSANTATIPHSDASERSAISSARFSPDSVNRRHPYPFQGIPLNSPSVTDRQISTLSEKTESTATSKPIEPTNSNPRVPRNIRALKDGRGEKPKGRTIVICLDGTGDKFDADNSNIIHLVSCLKKSDPDQITYYQSGIGTYDGGGLSNGFHAAMDMAVGSGLGDHIRDAYHFLMQNYKENDRICLFGFSRGAYTARCLAGMIHKVGLLPAHNLQQILFAYQYYKDDSEEGWKMSAEFKRTFCMDVSVYFIGVFDSVASVGFIPRTLPLSSTPYNKAVYFRHAMALDEHRAKFKVKQFEVKDSIDPGAHWETMAGIHEDAARGRAAPSFSPDLGEEADPYLRRKHEEAKAKETDVLEVWFAGAHCDVGGGAVPNTERHKLAQVPLRWMLRQCFDCDTGIIFKVHRLAEEGLDVHTLWPTYTALGVPPLAPPPSMVEKQRAGQVPPIARRSAVLKPVDEKEPMGWQHVELWKDPHQRELHDNWVPEHVEDYFDAVSPIHDELELARTWWILEVWPIKVHVLHRDEWVQKVSVNLGMYRPTREKAPNLHWTVQQRIKAMGYKAPVRMASDTVWNIVA